MTHKNTRIAALALIALCAACGEDKAPGGGGANNALNNTNNNNAANNETPYVPGDCVDEQTFFKAQVWEPILATRCVGCHNESGVAAQSRLKLIAADTPEALKHNLEVTAALAKEDANGQSILLRKPSGTHAMGHVGGAIIAPDSADWRALATFVARARGEADMCAAPAPQACDIERPFPGPQRVRRLSHDEYDATLAALLGQQPGQWRKTLAADVVVHGFRNNARALIATPLLVEQWLDAAERISEAYIAELPNRLPCASQGGEACAREFIEGFGRRAFRRPLTAEDTARYLELWRATSQADGFAQGIRDVMTAQLISPHFLYRMEIGEAQVDGTYALTPHEIAVELSYMLWGEPPDAALVAAADGGELGTPEQIEAQAKRLLADPRAAKKFNLFVREWLEIERLEHVVRDTNTYPEFTPAVRAAMLAETERFVTRALDGGKGTLPALLAAPVTELDPTLAAFYMAQAGEVEDTRRPGLLAQGSVLTTHALTTSSSPVHRGKIVRERMLCQHLPPPPPNLDTSLKDVEPGTSPRERFRQHSEDAACSGCHRLVDPIGFAFERFDGVGRWRDDYAGKPIDARGEIVNTAKSNSTFDGLDQLVDVLADSPDVHACFTLQQLRYGYGLEESDDYACMLCALEDGFVTKGGLTFESLALSMVRQPHFRTRVAEGTTPAQWYSPDTAPPADMGGLDMSIDMSEPPDMTSTPDMSSPSGPDTEGVSVREVIKDDWGAGWCQDVFVKNDSAGSLMWRITLEVGGTLTTSWNATPSAQSGRITFVGAPYNATLGAGEEATFGFCATR